MLNAYRRHVKNCPHRSKGRDFSLCECPVWCDGMVKGVRVGRSLGTSSWDRALRRLEILLAGGTLVSEKAPDAPSISLNKATTLFLEDARSRNLAPSTISSYQRTLESVTARFPKDSVNTVSVPMLDLWRKSCEKSPRTMRKEIEHLRAFWSFCVTRKWAAENPARLLRMPRVADIATMPFTPDEIERLLAACDRIASDDPQATPYIRRRARALLYALLYSGLRISDIAKLRRAALNESTGHLTVRTMKTGVHLKVQLHADAVRALVTLPARNPEYFFWTGRGAVTRCAKNMWRTVQRLGALAGVENARPHRFRDTFAVELLTQGADIRTVQKLLGHESVRTTEKHYAHFVAAHQALLDAATAKLDFTPKPTRPLLVHPLEYRRRDA